MATNDEIYERGQIVLDHGIEAARCALAAGFTPAQAMRGLSDGLGESALDGTGPRAVLEAFVTGSHARRLAAMEPEARVARTRGQAERVHPGLARVFERGASYAWDADRWARGDYAWFAPGELGAFGPHLSRPEGRVHFAGDHTSPLPGWMQGALASGRRAADEVDAAARGAAG